VSHEVIGQGHTRPKIDLEAWQMHHIDPLRSSRFSVPFVVDILYMYNMLYKEIHNKKRGSLSLDN